jgi:hypothetical protein
LAFSGDAGPSFSANTRTKSAIAATSTQHSNACHGTGLLD